MGLGIFDRRSRRPRCVEKSELRSVDPENPKNPGNFMLEPHLEDTMLMNALLKGAGFTTVGRRLKVIAWLKNGAPAKSDKPEGQKPSKPSPDLLVEDVMGGPN